MKALATSKLGEDQVFEEMQQAVVPIHDYGRPLDGQGLLGHDLDYIIKVPAHN